MAEATIDELQIEISASSASAADNLEKLAQKLERLGNVIQPIAANNGLEKIAKQLNKLSAISQKISQLSGFEKIGQVVSELRKIEQLGNAQDISPFMRNLNKLPRIVAAISQMPSVDATKFQKLADALKPLQSVSSSGINSLMNALRKLPKVSQELSGVDFTRFSQQIEQISRAIEPLARQAERAGQGLTAIAQIMQSTSRQARQSASGFGLFNQAIGNIKVKTLAAVAALRRLFSVLKNGVTASAAYVENLNLFSVTMGESADEALRFAESVNSALGVDTSDWIRYQGVFQSIGKGFGIVSSQADLMSKNLTQMSYDISSFYNISVDTAAMKLQSALSGEIMPMRQLGFAIEETTLKQVALNHGIKMSVENMTQAQKAQLRYVAIMEQAGNIGVLGDMARTIDTASNSMRVFQARLQQFSRAIGNMFMPILSAALPYITAFVQVLTEGAQYLADLFGFELPKIDFSGAQVSSGFDDITGAINEATEANKEFKGSLASIDQLNIIGSESESKNAANMGNQFDLGINLPEYDFLQGVESKTKQIAEDIKGWFKEALPWIEAVGVAIAGAFAFSKISKFIDGIKTISSLFGKNIGADKLKAFSKTLSGVVGGLTAGAFSGTLLFNGIKGLITKTGDLANNWTKVGVGVGVAGGAIAAFIALGNPVGAVITGIVAGIGAIAGVVVGLDEKTKALNDEIAASILYDNGGTKISEIADAFGNWADEATEVNNKLTAQFDALEGDRTKMEELKTQIEGVAGIKIDFNELTAADAEKLKAPFSELARYMKEDITNTATTLVQDLEKIFAGANLAGPLVEQVTKGYQEIIDLYGSNIDKAETTVNQYLTKITENGVLTEQEQQEFQRSYNLIMENQNAEDMKDLNYALNQLGGLDLSNINFQSDKEAVQAIQDVINEAEKYTQSIEDRLTEELKANDVLKTKTMNQYANGWIDLETYNNKMALLNQTDDIFKANAAKQLDTLADKMLPINDAINQQLYGAANQMAPDVGDYYAASVDRFINFDWFNFDAVDDLAQKAAADKYLNNSAIFAANKDLQNSLANIRDNAIEIKTKINTDNPIAQQLLDSGEAEAKINLKIVSEDQVGVAVKKAFETATGGDWSKYKPSLAATEGANIGFAREAYEKGRGSSEPFENSGNVEATVTVPVQLMVDGDVFVEKTITAIADLTYRNNGKPLW